MARYGQFCPVAKAAEVVAERWTPLIVRELLSGSRRFSEIECGVPRISRTLLVQRLRALERGGVIEHRISENGRVSTYHLTDSGRELAEIIMAMGKWGQRWLAQELDESDLDPDLLMWDLHRRLHTELLPESRTVVRFDLRGSHTRSYWLVVEQRETSICWGDPGFEVDLYVSADTLTLHRVWMGRQSMNDALRRELIELDGPRELVRAFPSWLALSIFAGIEPARTD